MKKKIDEKVIKQPVYDYYCNKCGDKIDTETHFLEEISIIGGYFNKHLEDMIKYRFSLCEKCLKELFNTFKIPVEEDDIGGFLETYQ